jgi:hypothetical protein
MVTGESKIVSAFTAVGMAQEETRTRNAAKDAKILFIRCTI